MPLIKAVLLGLVQGVTEFLPVSSSGHLVILRRLLGVRPPAESAKVLWEVVLHLGTLAAVLLVLRREVWAVVVGFVRGVVACRNGAGAALRDVEGFALALWIILGSVPAAVVGLSFREFLEGLGERPGFAAGALLVTGAFLFATRCAPPARSPGRVGWLDALLIGAAQAVAILPGISRSGATISAGLFRRVDRAEAVRFSFLLSIPAVAGAAFLECRHASALPVASLVPLLAGAAASAVAGVAALGGLLRVVRAGRLHLFAWYCWAVGALALAWLALGG